MTRPLPSQKRRARRRKVAAVRWLIENTDLRRPELLKTWGEPHADPDLADAMVGEMTDDQRATYDEARGRSGS